MMTKSWLLINLILLAVAAVAVKNTVDLPAEIRQQKKRTANAITPPETAPGTKNAKTTKVPPRKTAAAAVKTEQHPSAEIRRGSLTDIWQKSLFNKDRTEKLESALNDPEAKPDEELPAPPNFELIGILGVNQAKVAIIELRNNARGPFGNRGNMGRPGMPQRPQPPAAPQNPSASQSAFTPSFATVHEDDDLRDTGYKVTKINKEERFVILTKDDLDYKLSLDTNSSTAAMRRDNQNAYSESLRAKARAAEKQQQQQQQQQAQPPQQGQPQQNAPNGQPPRPPQTPQQQIQNNRQQPPLPPGMNVPGRVATPMSGGTAPVPGQAGQPRRGFPMQSPATRRRTFMPSQGQPPAQQQ